MKKLKERKKKKRKLSKWEIGDKMVRKSEKHPLGSALGLLGFALKGDLDLSTELRK